MQSKYSMKLKTIVDIHEMAIVHKATNYEFVTISNYDVSRPSLQLIGFYDYFQRERIHVWGKSEQAFWLTLGEELRAEVLDRLFSERIPAMVVCHRVIPPTEMVEAARKYDVTLLSTDVDTSEVIAQLIGTLRKYLSPRARSTACSCRSTARVCSSQARAASARARSRSSSSSAATVLSRTTRWSCISAAATCSTAARRR